MILKTTTNEFCFINVSFYETIADPRYFFEKDYEEMPEGSEHLFKDIYTAKADELYHHVLDKFGWAWRDPKYKSETELCSMLKWAKEKGLTIEELSI